MAHPLDDPIHRRSLMQGPDRRVAPPETRAAFDQRLAEALATAHRAGFEHSHLVVALLAAADVVLALIVATGACP